MSVESINKFMKDSSVEGGELQKKLKDAIESYTKTPGDEKAMVAAVIIPLAKEEGYDVEWEDFENVAKNLIESKKMDDEELENVSGGMASGVGGYRIPDSSKEGVFNGTSMIRPMRQDTMEVVKDLKEGTKYVTNDVGKAMNSFFDKLFWKLGIYYYDEQ